MIAPLSGRFADDSPRRHREDLRRAASGRFLAVCLAVLGVILAPTGAQAAFPGQKGLIAFQSDRDGDYEIYSEDPVLGQGPFRLTNNAAPDLEPAFSSGGTNIAFSSSRDGNSEI